MFKQVSPQVNFSELEEEVLLFWKNHKTFEKSLKQRQTDKRWTFLDGPPFVTGMPHYGSLLSSLPKDLFGRYWTMKGYFVRRVWGWDGHGLPIENKVETKLGVTRKKDIEEKIGVKKFIDECRVYVNQVSDEWEWYVDKIGRWVDFKHAYKTWDKDYMESVMWVFKNMYDKRYIYKGLRVSLYCPHCATPISNFEVAMDQDNYQEKVDLAATNKYKVSGQEDTYLLAWSTTPWNKIVTPALAVNPLLPYVKVKQGDEYYILAKSTLSMLKTDIPHSIIDEFKGESLVGLEFEPHYDYYKSQAKSGQKLFIVVSGNFVTAEEGTGIVTIAAYGEEDLEVMKKDNIPIIMHLDEEGTVKNEVPVFAGMYYLKANKAVNEDLKNRGLLYQEYEYIHKVPLCWRCHTRLYHAPLDAWYVDIQTLKPLLKKTNENIYWFPKHFKHGRFLKSLESAPDWNISRNRYWGSPVPVWECACGERFVPGSIAELEKESGATIKDLHKPEIDEVTIVCKKCGKQVKRVPEVLDSWIEAGSASFAERHFPFNKDWKLEEFFPPDFIAEYTGQIRAWFYVLHVIGAAIYETKAFNNVVVEGVILGTDGRKMSKNYGNYPDPKQMLKKYGGDALRLYLLGSPVMHGEDTLISEEQYRNQIRGTLLIFWNTYNFFITYALLDTWNINKTTEQQSVLDRWVISLLNKLIVDVRGSLDAYDTVTAIDRLKSFVSDFSTWYIRRSRDRVGPTADSEEDRLAFYQTAHNVLITLCKLFAPIVPFVTESMYKNLTNEESVHLSDYPNADFTQISLQLEEEMKKARDLASTVLMKRKELGIKVKIPLLLVSYKGPTEILPEVLNIVLQEVNVYEMKYEGKHQTYIVSTPHELLISDDNQDMKKGEARELVRMIQEERKKIGTTLSEKVLVTLPDWPEEHTDYIKKQSLVSSLSKGEFTVIKQT